MKNLIKRNDSLGKNIRTSTHRLFSIFFEIEPVTTLQKECSFQMADLLRKVGTGLLLGSMASVAPAATNLADLPIPVALTASKVKPNIMFALDNSGSMAWESITGTDATSEYSKGNKNFFSSYNNIYYNPNITYAPAINADGTLKAASSPQAAPDDGYNSQSNTTDVSLVCYSSTVVPTLSSGTTSCRSTSTSTYKYKVAKRAFYYVYDGSGSVSSNNNYTTRVEIIPTVTTYSGRSGRTDCASGSTCTYQEEIQNFANWWSYYRTRILTMRTAMGYAFFPIDDSMRVGFYTINDNSGNKNTTGANFINAADFTAAQRTAWYNKLYSITPSGGTPLQEAMRRVGEYYKTGALPGSKSSIDPVQYSCQKNFLILSTDGYWNDTLNQSVGDVDKNIPTLPAADVKDPISNTTLVSGQPWPSPFSEGATATSDSLSDVAAYYWATDLRTSGATSENNVPADRGNPATWQHMASYTIGLGASGQLPFTSDTWTHLLDGSTSWPAPVGDTKTAIDDLWHAAVNGHGAYLSASDPIAVQKGLADILADIAGRKSTFSANTVSNPNVDTSTGDFVTFSSSYNPGDWSGEIYAYPIDEITGDINTQVSLWGKTAGPHNLLDNRVQKNSDSRLIATFNGTAGTPFQWTNLTTIQKSNLGDDIRVLQFLRGWTENSGGLFRKRDHVLGDIVNAEGAVVYRANYHYADNGYDAYSSSLQSRPKTLYQAANDGMLHAFDASVGQANSAKELWAYVPGLVNSTLKNLSLATGFTHKYYLDGTPVIGDVDFAKTDGASGSPDWRTILVAGLGKGGRGYYALDVSSATAASEANVAAKVLWEFTDDDMGFSYGKPVITKTRANGWVVLVTSGYNNVPAAKGGAAGSTTGDGSGHLYVLNAKTGKLIKKIDIPDAGDVDSPTGFAHIAGLVQDTDTDNTVELVYGGDLNGDVWRIDLSASEMDNWAVSKFAVLKNDDNQRQPVTAVPETACFGNCSVKGNRMVYLGTGQYLDVPDVTTKQIQSFYGIKDDGLIAYYNGGMPSAADTRDVRDGTLVEQTMTLGGDGKRKGSANTVSSNAKGWYIDLPIAGERANTDPQLAMGVMVFTSNIPDNDPCSFYGGKSWLTYVDYKTGGVLRGADGNVGTFLGSALASRASIIMTKKGPVAMGSKTDSSIFSIAIPKNVFVTPKRVSWRELINQ